MSSITLTPPYACRSSPRLRHFPSPFARATPRHDAFFSHWSPLIVLLPSPLCAQRSFASFRNISPPRLQGRQQRNANAALPPLISGGDTKMRDAADAVA